MIRRVHLQTISFPNAPSFPNKAAYRRVNRNVNTNKIRGYTVVLEGIKGEMRGVRREREDISFWKLPGQLN